MKWLYFLLIPVMMLNLSCRKKSGSGMSSVEKILTEGTWTGHLRIIYDPQGNIFSQDTIDYWYKTFKTDGTVELRIDTINITRGTWRLEDKDTKIIYNWENGGDEIYLIKKINAELFIETSDDEYLELSWTR